MVSSSAPCTPSNLRPSSFEAGNNALAKMDNWQNLGLQSWCILFSISVVCSMHSNPNCSCIHNFTQNRSPYIKTTMQGCLISRYRGGKSSRKPNSGTHFSKTKTQLMTFLLCVYGIWKGTYQVNDWNEWRNNLLLLLMIPYPNLNRRNSNVGQGELILLPPSLIVVMGEVLR